METIDWRHCTGHVAGRGKLTCIGRDERDARKSCKKELETAVWKIDRDQPIADVMPMKELIADKLFSREIAFKLIAAFAGVVLMLAALGLYGLLAYRCELYRRAS